MEVVMDCEERVKRQVSRTSYMNYMNQLRNPNYDPRAEEGDPTSDAH